MRKLSTTKTGCHRSSFNALLVGVFALLGYSKALSAPNLTENSQGIIECTPDRIQQHNPGLAGKSDRIICFEGYISNFNTGAATLARNRSRHWAVPHWVVHHVQARS